ncbi:MAG: GFA family protein [Luteimonas sp.]
MATKTHTASCHCGSVRLEVDIDLEAGGGKCNCSICCKTRNWSASVKPDAFRLLGDETDVIDYQFGTNSVHWPFCRVCGVRAYGYGDIPEMGGKFFSVNLACLDDVSADTLAAMPVRYCNGRDNDWLHEPSDAEKKYL